MENLKIRVNSIDESREIQNILESKGFKKWAGWSELGSIGGFIWTDSDMTYCDNEIEYFDESPREEITLPELRAMVNPMKEYLEKQPDGTYSLVLRGDLCKESDILIPEGAEVATASGLAVYFWKPSDNKTFVDNVGWSECDGRSICTLDSYLEDSDVSIIWQREQDEPFLTPECTLNDQAEPDLNFEAAQASGGVDATLTERQSQYGCYEDVAHVTQQILSALRIGNYDELPAPMKESLHMIASKMARIVNGDPKYLDNWHDIGGYAKLIEKLIEGN